MLISGGVEEGCTAFLDLPGSGFFAEPGESDQGRTEIDDRLSGKEKPVSYLVLARKWRPSRFSDLVGQSHVGRTLENAIKQDRVAHAYLFSGPRGVGKTSTARILAAAMNCEKGPTAEPCGKCEPCQDVASGRSLDVIEIDGASNRGIDEIRDLRQNVRYMASAGKRKIYIIDEVHMLTTEAFNALLKTLEEPPAHVLFIFATTRATKLPATILSRCIRFDFKRISTKDIMERLREVIKGEGFEADERSLHLVARAADGGMRDALSLLEQVRAFSGNKLDATEVEEALGVVDEELLFSVSEAARESSPAGALSAVQQLVDRGRDPGDFLLALEEHYRNLLVALVSDNVGEQIDAPEETIERYKSDAAAFEADDLIRSLTLLGEGARDLRNSPRPRLVLEMLLLRLIRMDSTVTIGALMQRLESGMAGAGAPAPRPITPGNKKKNSVTAGRPETAPVAPPAPIKTTAPPSPRAVEPVPVSEPTPAPEPSPAMPDQEWNPRLVARKWKPFLTHLSQQNAMAASLLHGSSARARSKELVEIVFPRGHSFQMEQALDDDNKSAIQSAFKTFFQYSPRFRASIGDQFAEGDRKKKEALKSDPRIGRILEMLDGEIIT